MSRKVLVSIPFNWESLYKVATGKCYKRRFYCFHSLQPGRHIQRRNRRHKLLMKKSFHSVQTGKRIQSTRSGHSYRQITLFPFPSNRKAYRKSTTPTDGQRRNRFHSLRPGKRIASILLKIIETALGETFPFPSSGKAYRKVCLILIFTLLTLSFHSLPPGKRIQSNLTSGEKSKAA